jgi:pimeloyl-ACP methyl ester carboxylesterase
MRRATFTIATLLLAAALVGCHKPPPPTLQPPPKDTVYILPGIGCGEWCFTFALQGFRDAGVTADLSFVDWHSPFYDPLGHLTNYEANLQHAADIASDITTTRTKQPDGRIDLVGYSGGGGLAVLVAEALPDGVHINNLVLVQAAISPTYNLAAALNHVDGKLVNLHCGNDWAILGLGTQTFGTIDRSYGPSAGKDGFVLHSAIPDKQLRRKVVQIPWTTDMFWKSGHLGGHAGLLGYAWNRDYVAPWLLPDPPPPSP